MIMKCCPVLSQLTIRLSTKNILDWIIYLHDPHHFTMSQVMLYGKEMINVQSSVVSGTVSQYQVEPIGVNHINQEDEPCISDEDKVTDLWDCITDHMYSKMNCTLPWASKAVDKDIQLCSSPEEYDLYYAEIKRGRYRDSQYIEKVAKCTPGCKRVEYSAKLGRNAQDQAPIDEWKLRIYYAKDKFPSREQFYIYSTANLIADFGGYLGLLLGYSLLGFYDSMMDFFEIMVEKCKEKSRASQQGGP